jgi:hypothetical protein
MVDIEYKHLDELASGQTQILVFDCEFWHVKQAGNYILNGNTDYFFMPREFGGFVLTKKDNNVWTYTTNFFISLTAPIKNVALPISHYSTVSPQNGYKLDEIEKKIGVGWGDAFPTILNDEQKLLHEQAIEIYQNDDYIKNNRRDPREWYEDFVKLWSNSTIVVKGTGDIDAIKNACVFYGIDYIEPISIIDIALWNKVSYLRCKTSKLEGTYLCVKPDFDKGLRAIEKILPLDKAHDPSTDASMTFLVALYIIKTNTPVSSFWSNLWG